MKGNVIIALSLVVCLSVVTPCTLIAQEKKITKKDVPAAVILAFEKAYPKAVTKAFAEEVENGKNYFEIESIDGKMTRDLLYLADGTVAEIEEGVAPADLPAAVKAAVSSKYPKGRVDKAEKTSRGSKVTYDLQVIIGKAKVNLSVEPSGKILKESKAASKNAEKEEDEENEQD